MEKEFNFGNKSGFSYKSSAHPCAQKKHALLNKYFSKSKQPSWTLNPLPGRHGAILIKVAKGIIHYISLYIQLNFLHLVIVHSISSAVVIIKIILYFFF